MGHGIGPQSLGAAGQNPKSKPCGTPLDFNEKLRAAERAGKLPESFAKEVRADSAANYGSPLPMAVPGGVPPNAMGGMVQGIGSLFGRRIQRKRQLANNRDMADSAPGPASPGGGSSGIQSDLEGLQSKLADLKSQIDNLANTV
mgnify:CR=1 FL=1|tara:strand:+ start:252 stop:683 length:432 start_codon:yes stop_codon:yes gene_type:complete